MTGLDKIIATIQENSDSQNAAIIENAEKKAEQIIADAEKTAAENSRAFSSETEKMVEKEIAMATSSAQMKYKQTLLSSKVDIINETLKDALAAIKKLPDEEYFSVLTALAVKYAESGNGVIRLGKDDSSRVPSDFADKLNAILSKSGKSVVVGENADIDSGFVLVYGDVEINCSFDAVIAENRDELRDRINEILFN